MVKDSQFSNADIPIVERQFEIVISANDLQPLNAESSTASILGGNSNFRRAMQS